MNRNMYQFSALLPLSMLLGCLAPASDDANSRGQETRERKAYDAGITSKTRYNSDTPDDVVSKDNAAGDLPYSRGRTFADLPEYLAYLKQYNGPIDLPWWRQIGPETYELQSTATNAEKEVLTFYELQRRYGFAD